MWDLRRQVSLLKGNGHSDADLYHIGRVYDEAKLVVDRLNGHIATEGVVIQAATMTTGMGASKQAGEYFKKLIQDLSGDS